MDADPPVYALAQLLVTDVEGFQRDYVGPLQPINARHGVEVVVAKPKAAVVEGDYAPNFTVVLRFPSQAAFDAWYADPDYQPLIERRRALTDPAASSLVTAPALAG